MTTDDAAIEQLVERARAGDAEAFGELFDLYHVAVYRYVASRLRRVVDAEDLTQTVFVKALEALPRYESRGIPFGGWLFRLARNSVIDFVRTHRDHVDVEVLTGHRDESPAPAETVVMKTDIEAVGEALKALTDEQREVIALRFFAGLSAKEAAEAMGKQEGTIRGLQFRAVMALRRQLGIEVQNEEPEAQPSWPEALKPKGTTTNAARRAG